MPISAAELLRDARLRAHLSQRELARRAGTAQSVVARIELGATSPSWDTLSRLLTATGHVIEPRLGEADPDLSALLAEVPRILALSTEDRLRELRNADRFVVTVRRAAAPSA
jgi:transcriptional regulator with XRE-family HTH domain